MATNEHPRRPQSKLEQDDPQHCRKCGAEIDHDGYTDKDGRPISWVGSGPTVNKAGWQPIERCRSCWLDDHIRQLELEADERYHE